MSPERYNALMEGATTTEADLTEARRKWWVAEFGACLRDNRAAAFAQILIPLAITAIALAIGMAAVLLIGGMPNISMLAIGALAGLIIAIIVIIAAYFYPES